MSWSWFLQTVLRAVLLTILVTAFLTVGQAEVMTSSNYQIDSDSINTGGGLSTSSSYRQESTVGEVATGDSASTNYRLRAGYQQMEESYISLSALADVALAPNLGLSGGVASGSTSFIVTTDNQAGYQATLAAASSPAMQSATSTIANYLPSGSYPDYSFLTGPSQAHFAVSVEGNDIAARYRDNGSLCGVGVLDTINTCWDAVSTIPTEVARSAVSNHPVGATTTLKFRVGVGATASVPYGTYTATSTITAITL